MRRCEILGGCGGGPGLFGQLPKRAQPIGQARRMYAVLSFSTDTVARFSDVLRTSRHDLADAFGQLGLKSINTILEPPQERIPLV